MSPDLTHLQVRLCGQENPLAYSGAWYLTGSSNLPANSGARYLTGSSYPPMMLSKVVLLEPLEPIRHANSPWTMSRDKPCTLCTVYLPIVNYLRIVPSRSIGYYLRQDTDPNHQVSRSCLMVVPYMMGWDAEVIEHDIFIPALRSLWQRLEWFLI